jgi:hypothetical protein
VLDHLLHAGRGITLASQIEAETAARGQRGEARERQRRTSSQAAMARGLHPTQLGRRAARLDSTQKILTSLVARVSDRF